MTDPKKTPVNFLQATREDLAREEFLRVYCAWWPAIYASVMPRTSSAAVLIEAKGIIEGMMRADAAQITNALAAPAKHAAPPDAVTRLVDWSDVDPAAELALACESSPARRLDELTAAERAEIDEAERLSALIGEDDEDDDDQ